MSQPTEGEESSRSTDMKRTLLIAGVVVIAGALIAGAVLYVSAQDNPEVVETRSAQEAWEYASAGWRCKVPTEEGLRPINLEVLELFARAEKEAGSDARFWAGSASPAHCTEPSS